ncbi:hypothetical protein WR25_04049 [Diploscapter pachys]|uniref:Uncharacterized protein n=1 Tax=Diploscapter pachys TaxID=2018661 RepID=A0A2A2KM36_9BILA|nr:hypothetical protein WR25_04049 [Diploscapter pachys]
MKENPSKWLIAEKYENEPNKDMKEEVNSHTTPRHNRQRTAFGRQKEEGQPDRKMVKAEEEDKGGGKTVAVEGNVIIADADRRAILESGNVKLKEERRGRRRRRRRMAKRGITDRSDNRQADRGR